MQRFRPFLHKPLDESRLRDGTIAEHGARPRWVPETLEAFDEVELAMPLDAERDLVVTISVENGGVERILLGYTPPGDDDADFRGFTPEELEAALFAKGDALVDLVKAITAA